MAQFITIDSADIRGGDRVGDARYYMDADTRGADRMALLSYDVLVNYPTINVSNKTAYLETTSQTFPLEIGEDWYNATELGVEVAAALNTLGLGLFSVVYDEEPVARYRISAPVECRFISDPVINPNWTWADMIGMNTTRNAPYLLSLVGGLSDLSPLGSILYITSTDAHQRSRRRDNASSRNMSNILGVVYLYQNKDMNQKDAASYGPIHATGDYAEPKMVRIASDFPMDSIDIQIRDARGRVIPSDPLEPARIHYQLTIGVYEGPDI